MEFGMHNLEPVYFYLALAGTFFFLLKFSLALFGFDGDAPDLEALDPENLDFKFLSVQTLSIFSASLGWIGLLFYKHTNLGEYASFALSFILSLGIAFFEVWIFAKIKGLRQINKLNLENAIGKIGKVYMTIPENGIGEIQVSFQGKMRNRKASSVSGEKISAFTEIRVSYIQDGILIVEKV